MTIKKDYYAQRLDEISDLIDQKEFKKALKIVADEISAPYIPKDYLDAFEKLYADLCERVNIQEIQEKYNSMTKKELLLAAYNGRKLDINILGFFLAKFHPQIDKFDFIVLEQIFLDPSISNEMKLFALEQIKLCEIDHTFIVHNNMTNVETNVNTQSNFEFENDPYYQKVVNNIESQLFKDPSLKPLASYTLKLCYEYYFGSKPPYSAESLANNISQYIKGYFDDNVQVDHSFVTWVNSLFTSKKLKN